ncbi:MAG TPA: alpha/beta hydrolase [Allosphingosinicella sp.]|nr:alpha/beta hydrolase [Allosphingosinicella sp.]
MPSFFNLRSLAAAVALSAATACSHVAPATPVSRAETVLGRISVRHVGSGPDVVLIHGLGGSTKVWTKTLKSLPRNYRVHLVQIAGFGGASARANADGPVLDPVVDELARYIRSSAKGRAKLVGHSMGGAIALRLAHRHPELVGAVMVVDMVPNLGSVAVPQVPASAIPKIAEGARRQWLSLSDQERATRNEANLKTMMISDRERAATLNDMGRSDPRAFAQGLHDLLSLDQRPGLSSIKVPVTIVYAPGQNVVGFSPRDADSIYRDSYADLPEKRLVPVPGALHMIMHDQPLLFVRELKRFLKN